MRLTAVADEHNEALGSDHSEVAVNCLSRVDEEAGRSCGGKGCRHLAADQARLAHAADDQVAGIRQDRLHCVVERVVERKGQVLQRPRLLPDGLRAEEDR